jgi:hypothetical protein
MGFRKSMKPSLKNVLKAFSVELPLYAALVLAYGLFVLHFLGGWLFQLFREERRLYAVVALGLIIVQGFFLEICARALLELVKGQRDK